MRAWIDPDRPRSDRYDPYSDPDDPDDVGHPDGVYEYPKEITQWRAVHLFHWNYWDVMFPPEGWLRKQVAIELEWQKIEARIIRQSVDKARDTDGESENPNEKVVFDKKKGGFLGHQPAKPYEEPTPVEEFAGRASRPTMTTKELRGRLAEIHDQQAAEEN